MKASKMQILIADDNPTTRIIMRKTLVDFGCNVTEAVDGEEAWINVTSESPPDIALLDWEMPKIDGITLCQKILRHRREHYIYIIMVTSRNQSSDLDTGFASGADDYIVKPLDRRELRNRIQAACRILHYERELREKELRVRMECYNALTELAEMRDDDTGSHLRRVSRYSGQICRQAGMPPELTAGIKRFAGMHDIGKVGIPDNILLAPRKLTNAEFAIIKSHTTLGWRILKDKPTLELAADIALNHHERWDGSGYPHGLAGAKIPLCGRVVAIADVYDALRNTRPYKEPWSHEKATAYIAGQAGKQFDPDLVKVFVAINREFLKISEENASHAQNSHCR